MKDCIIGNLSNFIVKYNNYSDVELQRIKYGLEGIYLTLTKTVVIFLLSIIFGIFKEVLLVIILFNIIRYTGFGFHAEKSYQCLICSLINFILLPLLFIKINISFTAKILIAVYCIINYLIFAPADTVKRPLPTKKKRIIRKILTVFIGIVYMSILLIFNTNIISNILLCCLVIEMIVINPITYKLFKQPYKNYAKKA